MVARISYKKTGKTRLIKSALNKDGYLTNKDGKVFLNGEAFSALPYEDAAALEERIADFLEDKFDPISAMIGSEFEQYLLKFGDNGNIVVTDFESDLRQGEAELCFKSFQFGLCCAEYVPENIWDNCMKPFATYHAGTDDEEDFLEDCDVYDQPARGWFYSDCVLDALRAEGINCSLI